MASRATKAHASGNSDLGFFFNCGNLRLCAEIFSSFWYRCLMLQVDLGSLPRRL